MPDDLVNARTGLVRLVERPDEVFYAKARKLFAGFAVKSNASKDDLLLTLLMLGDPRVEHLQRPEVAQALLEGRDIPPPAVEPSVPLCGKKLHEMTPENTAIRRKGNLPATRECITCRRINQRERSKRFCGKKLHEKTPENTKRRLKNGQWSDECIPCRQKADRERKARK